MSVGRDHEQIGSCLSGREINNIYSSYDSWKQWDQIPFGTYNKKQHHYFKKLLSNNLRTGRETILEIGFGNGSLAGWLRNTYPSAKWIGAEIQEPLVTKANASGYESLLDLPTPGANFSFDVIVAFDVLEHLNDSEIRNLFTDILALLKENGVVIARVPNGESPMGLPNQNGDPTHVTNISLSRLSAYLGEWRIECQGDLRPLWEGKFLSFIRNIIRLLVRETLTLLIRFAFAPQPRTFLASNIHLIFRRK
jgi:SAM-dependent methyltransferase